MDPSMSSKVCHFALDRLQCQPTATTVQQQSSGVLPSYPVDVLLDQETEQRDLLSHMDLVPNGTGVRSGSPGVVGGPRLLLYVDSRDKGRHEAVHQEETNWCSV